MSFTGYTMMIPLLKVRDKSTGNTHIIGSDSHDQLTVDKHGGIQYSNIQNKCGTTKYSDEDAEYEFVKNEDAFECYSEIEFVSIETLLDIYKQHVEDLTEAERIYREEVLPSLQKYMDEIKKGKGIVHT